MHVASYETGFVRRAPTCCGDSMNPQKQKEFSPCQHSPDGPNNTFATPRNQRRCPQCTHVPMHPSTHAHHQNAHTCRRALPHTQKFARAHRG